MLRANNVESLIIEHAYQHRLGETRWDLAMCVFITVFAANECSSDLETAALILLSV